MYKRQVNETGWLQAVIDEVHAAGGVFIADEVQAGLARLGSKMWGFQYQGVVPDIVTLGKPMGNGIPLSGVVFRPEVARDFGEKAVSYTHLDVYKRQPYD